MPRTKRPDEAGKGEEKGKGVLLCAAETKKLMTADSKEPKATSEVKPADSDPDKAASSDEPTEDKQQAPVSESDDKSAPDDN